MSCNFSHPKIWSLGVQHQLLSRKRNYCQTPKFNLDFKKLATLCHIASMIFVSSYICKKTYKNFAPISPKWEKWGIRTQTSQNLKKMDLFDFIRSLTKYASNKPSMDPVILFLPILCPET